MQCLARLHLPRLSGNPDLSEKYQQYNKLQAPYTISQREGLRSNHSNWKPIMNLSGYFANFSPQLLRCYRGWKNDDWGSPRGGLCVRKYPSAATVWTFAKRKSYTWKNWEPKKIYKGTEYCHEWGKRPQKARAGSRNNRETLQSYKEERQSTLTIILNEMYQEVLTFLETGEISLFKI